MGQHARHEASPPPVTRRVIHVVISLLSADVVVDTLHLILAVLVAYGIVGSHHG